MTKTLWSLSKSKSPKNYNLNANKDLVIFQISQLITCFVDGFTSIMKSRSIAYLLSESEHMYWILDLEVEVHSKMGFMKSSLQECEGNFLSIFFRNQVEWTNDL